MRPIPRPRELREYFNHLSIQPQRGPSGPFGVSGGLR
jgi:hypothetical protein